MAGNNDKPAPKTALRQLRKPLNTRTQSSASAEQRTLDRVTQSIANSPIGRKFKFKSGQTNLLADISPSGSVASLLDKEPSPQPSIANSPTPSEASIARSAYQESEAPASEPDDENNATIIAPTGPQFRQHIPDNQDIPPTDNYALRNKDSGFVKMPSSLGIPRKPHLDLTPARLLQLWLKPEGINFRDQFQELDLLTSNSVGRIRNRLHPHTRIALAALALHALYHATVETQDLRLQQQESTQELLTTRNNLLQTKSSLRQMEQDFQNTLNERNNLNDQLDEAATTNNAALDAFETKVQNEVVAPMKAELQDTQAYASTLLTKYNQEIKEHNHTKALLKDCIASNKQLKAWYLEEKPNIDAYKAKALFEGLNKPVNPAQNPFEDNNPATDPFAQSPSPSILPRHRRHDDSVLNEFTRLASSPEPSRPAAKPAPTHSKRRWESYTPPDSQEAVQLNPFLTDLRLAFANLHIYNDAINRDAPKPKRFSSIRDEF